MDIFQCCNTVKGLLEVRTPGLALHAMFVYYKLELVLLETLSLAKITGVPSVFIYLCVEVVGGWVDRCRLVELRQLT